jgi:thermitase
MQVYPSSLRRLITRSFSILFTSCLIILSSSCSQLPPSGFSEPSTDTPTTDTPSSDVPATATPGADTSFSEDHILTITLDQKDTPETVARQYDGKVLVWEEGVYALVALSEKAAQTQTGEIESNKNRFLAGGQSAWMSGRSKIWAGGRSKIWAGGRSKIWSGGAPELWSEGSYTWMPENTPLWQKIRLEQGHALAENLGLGIKVAVIDTGVDLTHPALQEALAPEVEWWDFYGNDALPQEEGTFEDAGYGHGTNVAGIIRQIAPRATILPLRVLGADGQGDVDKLAAAIQWAVAKGCQVINLSLGSDRSSKAIEAAINQATIKGVLIVTSTGNTGDHHVTYPSSSAAADKKGWLRLSVTSVDLQDAKSDFSTYSKEVELAAPGENVFGPAPEDLMAAWTGTSMAAPMAAGALALALGEELVVPANNLADELKVRSADIYNNSLNEAYKDRVGKGRLDLEEFLKNVIRH